jgi:hypothetical protein
MKIISKYKDYYDYLVGQYGIDEKLVLDRTKSTPLGVGLIEGKITVYLAGWAIDGYVKDYRVYYGDDLAKVGEISKVHRWFSDDPSGEVYLTIAPRTHIRLRTSPYWDKEQINEIQECPILLKYMSEIYYYPKLETLDLASVWDAFKVYRLLTDWLSKQLDNKELSTNPSDINKIESKGFDKKRSFRPKMKK